MKSYNISRKDRRKAEKSKQTSKRLRKGATTLSSALVVSSIVAPIIAPKIAEATEDTAASEQVEYANEQETTDSSVAQDTSTSSDTSTEETQSSSETTQETNQTETEEANSRISESVKVASYSAPTSVSITGDKNSFISDVATYAQSVASANDLYASIMIAQAILESGWGSSALSSAPNYNLFGIKGSYQGQSVTMSTWEVINGQTIQVDAAFRKYPSYAESFADNAYVLKNTSFQSGVYYYSGAWKSNTTSYQDATAWLTGRYATDPSYGTKLNNLIAAYNLTQYDTTSTNGGSTGSGTNTDTNTSTGTNTGTNTSTGESIKHTVQFGDSLWALANKYGTTVAAIKSWNNLSGDVIYVGQTLIVGQGSSSNTGSSSTGTTTSTNETNSSSTSYTVKSGDTLWAIANANGVSVANLREWNNISGSLIYPGQSLIVKKGNTSGSSTNTSTSTSTNDASTTSSNTGTSASYTVKSGDSLWAIANANGVSVANLREWNNISGSLIYPGQSLIVKKGSTSGSSTSTSTSTTQTSTQSGSTHKVVSGNTLWGLAQTYGTSVQNIKQLNGLTSDLIYIGQTLKVT